MNNLKYIIESLLFVSATPLSMERLRQSVPEADSKMIRDALEALDREYETRGGGFTLHQVAGGYQLRTRPEYAQWIKRLHQTQPVRLSKPALETLAIIAYRQPVLRSDIEYIRGVDSGGVLKMLMEKQLIRVLGRDKEKAGRPIIYATTKRFLEIFDLKDLGELPTLKELEELGLAKKQTELETEGPAEMVPALPDAAGFAEFQNRRGQSPGEAFDLSLLGPTQSAEKEQEPEDGEDQEGSPPEEFAVDEDRYPQEVQYPEEDIEEVDSETDDSAVIDESLQEENEAVDAQETTSETEGFSLYDESSHGGDKEKDGEDFTQDSEIDAVDHEDPGQESPGASSENMEDSEPGDSEHDPDQLNEYGWSARFASEEDDESGNDFEELPDSGDEELWEEDPLHDSYPEPSERDGESLDEDENEEGDEASWEEPADRKDEGQE